MPGETVKCETCRLYCLDPQTGEGTCRRFPPVPVFSLPAPVTVWPRVQPDDWCGWWCWRETS